MRALGNESGFRPPLCTYRLKWVRRTSWGWWDDWDDTVLQTQDSKFEPWRSEAEHATSRSRRLPAILTFTRGWGRNILFLSNRRDREPNPQLWRDRSWTHTAFFSVLYLWMTYLHTWRLPDTHRPRWINVRTTSEIHIAHARYYLYFCRLRCNMQTFRIYNEHLVCFSAYTANMQRYIGLHIVPLE